MTAFVIRLSGLLVAIAAFAGAAEAQQVLVGRATVIDGDTIELSGERVRLFGIDAPESSQLCLDASRSAYRCGQLSAAALDQFLAASRPTLCRFVDRDQYDRFVGYCTRQDGADVAAWLVGNGWALDWPQYSQGIFAQTQEQARLARIGIWQGDFVEPWAWRQGERLAGERQTPPAAAEGCLIKGNISGNGDRIYHLPGTRDYDQTVIRLDQGERWFCTENEAIAAGWRAPLD